MATAVPIHEWQGPSRRRLARYRLQAPLDVTVLRSGIPDTVPGRSVNLCERGIATVLAAEILPGETVGIEMQLPQAVKPLRARATVRYHDQLRCGMEFVGLTPEQRTGIREWAERSKAGRETEPAPSSPSALAAKDTVGGKRSESGNGGSPAPPPKRRFTALWIALIIVAAFMAGVLLWRWNRGWEELESDLPGHASLSTDRIQAEVPTEVMQGLLVHKVDPVYPAAARKDRLQGVIVLDIVVGRDGTVVDVRPQNGPDVLAHAAMEAVRWWTYEPYRVNGEPAVVRTRMAVEFKP